MRRLKDLLPRAPGPPRVAAALEHHRAGACEAVFHATTLEECSLPDASFDAVFFHEALHHVLDEERGLAECFRLLRPGGVLGVSESAWIPGDRSLEEELEAEIARYGTSESPFTQPYLDYLLEKHGFVEVHRYHAVNGLFRRELGTRTIEEVAQGPARSTNNLTARKPGPLVTSADHRASTLAEVAILRQRVAGSAVELELRLRNVGRSTWLAGGQETGNVNVALRSGMPGQPGFAEAGCRCPLPAPLAPGGAVVLPVSFGLPEAHAESAWEVDLVCEGLFWFSLRGAISGAVALPLRHLP